MKLHKYTYSLLSLAVLFTLINCQDLNYNEETGNVKEDVFTDIARAKNFVSGLYASIPADLGGGDGIDNALRSTASDDAEHVNDVSDVQKFNEGSWSSVQLLDNVWGNMYGGIRAANVYLKETEGETFEDQKFTNNYRILMEQFNNYAFEVRFLRAYFYFELVKRYKNVPLITTVLTPEEATNVKQASFQEVVDFIVKECDETAAVLPINYTGFAGANETGRATKGAALALKSRMLLYAASPLHNDPVNPVLWQKAAEAAKELFGLGYTIPAPYAGAFNNVSLSPGPELIFEKRTGNNNSFETRNTPIGFQRGQGLTNPTQNLVDAYETTTGLPITDPASRYNEQLPYNSRDPRLLQTVLRNGAPWKGVNLQTFTGGANALPIANATKTGYYLRKYVTESINLDLQIGPITTREKNWTVFRFAEILLNYAEAMNEAYGPQNIGPGTLDVPAIAAVNLVRRRAGMPNFPAGLTKEAFRTKLRNERRVELAFEDHRFWDIRRWKIGKETENIFAMNITRNANLSLNFQVRLLEFRPWNDRMYLYPIPQVEIIKNKNLVQNPDW